MSSVDAAIAAAQAKAEAQKNLPAETAPQGQTAPAVAAPQAMPRTYSSADMTVGAMAVDGWLQVAHAGISVKGKNGIVYDLEVGIDFNKVSYNETVKFGNNPTIYKKTYDGVTTTDGQPWQQALAEARRVDPRAAPYRSADLPMVVLKDVVATVAGGKQEVLATAGTVLGHSLSTTNRQNFAELVADMKAKGLSADANGGFGGSNVMVKLLHEPREKGTNKWGLFKFELLGEITEEGESDSNEPAAAQA